MAEHSTLTYADLAAMPEDGLRRELIGGELVVSPSPKVRHQSVVVELTLAFGNHIKAHGGARVWSAPLDVLLSGSDVVEPDLVIVRDDQSDIVTQANINGVPALLVEVVSDSRYDRVRKRDLYERFGVSEYWIVDPDADRIEVYRLTENRFGKPSIVEPGEYLETAVLPGFRLDVAEVFAR
ncbi:MAG: Uma2 family endonuclease [Actinomycetota bacterium]|nr:Uma2 family endonuclease [Actinomycetota bacterium]